MSDRDRSEVRAGEVLSPTTPADLRELEAVIERGLETFVQVGVALREIRDRKLYLETHPTWDDYCRQRWGFSRIHAHRMIDAATVSAMLPMGNLPDSERQARELGRLSSDPEAVRAVWAEVQEEHGNSVTAADIRAAVDRRLGRDGGAQRVWVHVEPTTPEPPRTVIVGHVEPVGVRPARSIDPFAIESALRALLEGWPDHGAVEMLTRRIRADGVGSLANAEIGRYRARLARLSGAFADLDAALGAVLVLGDLDEPRPPRTGS